VKYAFWKYPLHFLAYGFGTGLVPFAPGTFGSLIGVALFWFMAPLGAVSYAGIVVMLFVAGIFICGQTARDTSAVDPGFIVYDEIVGFAVAMYLMPREWRWIAAGFVVYRIFDIWKPFPIHIVEEKLQLGTAIMADDVIAGIYTLLILQLARLILEKFVP
jgi:phosphatidylglycerophosphatase A